MFHIVRISVHKLVFCRCPFIKHLFEFLHRRSSLILLVIRPRSVKHLLSLIRRRGLVQQLLLRLGADPLQEFLDLLHLEAGDVQVLHVPLLLLEKLVLPRRRNPAGDDIHRCHSVFVRVLLRLFVDVGEHRHHRRRV